MSSASIWSLSAAGCFSYYLYLLHGTAAIFGRCSALTAIGLFYAHRRVQARQAVSDTIDTSPEMRQTNLAPKGWTNEMAAFVASKRLRAAAIAYEESA